MPRIVALLCLLAMPVLAQADPISAPTFRTDTPRQSYLPESDKVDGVVALGQDAAGKAWPCGAPQVVFGCPGTPTALAGQGSGTITAAGTAQQIVPASTTRRYLVIYNRAAAGGAVLDIGVFGVTAGGGIPLSPGGGYVFEGAGARGPVYGIAPVPGVTYSYVEG